MDDLGLNTIVLSDEEVLIARALISAAMAISSMKGEKQMTYELHGLLDNFLIPIGNE
jgi:hypothetical protein